LNRLSKLNDYSVGYKTSDIGQKDYYLNQARRQDLAAGGPKTRWSGPKTKREGHIFQIQYWMYAATGGANVKWGGSDFKSGGRTTLPPRWRRPWLQYWL